MASWACCWASSPGSIRCTTGCPSAAASAGSFAVFSTVAAGPSSSPEGADVLPPHPVSTRPIESTAAGQRDHIVIEDLRAKKQLQRNTIKPEKLRWHGAEHLLNARQPVGHMQQGRLPKRNHPFFG